MLQKPGGNEEKCCLLFNFFSNFINYYKLIWQYSLLIFVFVYENEIWNGIDELNENGIIGY